MAITIPPANKVAGQGGFMADIDNAYAALQTVVGIDALDAQWAGGADPTGTAFSDAAVAAALAAVPSNGATLLFRPGLYKFASTITPVVSGTVLAGLGWGSQLSFDGTSVTPLIATSGTTRIRAHVRDMRITQAAASSAGTAIEASHWFDAKIERVLIDGATNPPLVGISFNSSDAFYNVVSDCRVNCGGASSIGIRFDGGANSNVVRNCRVVPDGASSTGIGIYVNASTIELDHPDIESGAGYGISVGASGHGCTIVNPYLESNNVNLALASGVVAPIVIGGTIEAGVTADIQDNGALEPVYLPVRSSSGGNHSYGRLSLRAIASGPDIVSLLDSTGAQVWQVTNAGSMVARKAAAFTSPVVIGSATQDAGGSGSGLTLCHTTDPATNPASGHAILYVDASGNVLARTQAGNVRTVAAV